jgi:hypothetical protein
MSPLVRVLSGTPLLCKAGEKARVVMILKMVALAACMSALLAMFAVRGLQDDPEPVAAVAASGEEDSFRAAWASAMKDVELASGGGMTLHKSDREQIANVDEPKPIRTESIIPAGVKVPPILVTEAKVSSTPTHHESRNLCQRNNMRKVWISKTRWRCRK